MTRKSGRKVLMVLESNYPTEGGGGAEGQLRTINRYLNTRGIPVSVIVPMRSDGVQREHDSVDGVPVWRIPYPKVRKIGGLVMLCRLAAALYWRRRDYDVIHAHMAHNMAAVASAAGRLLGKPVIVKVTGSMEMDDGILDVAHHGPGAFIKRALFRCATYFQATSQEIRDRLIEIGIAAGRIRVIPNAVDIERFASAANREDGPGDRPMTAIYVGRLSEEKAPGILLSAWLEAFSVDAPVRLLLVGDGAMRESLKRQIADAGRENQVVLLGPQADVGAFLAQADLAVLPSLHEGLSNALLEYMAAGLPVLGTRVSGTVDFIKPGLNGWLVEPGDSAALAENLRMLAAMDRAALRAKGMVARQHVMSRARIDAVVGQLAELYQLDAGLLKTAPQHR